MAGNIGMELNLAVGEIHCVSKKFIPSKFNTCIKNSRRLHLLKHTMFLIVMITMATVHSTCEQRCLLHKLSSIRLREYIIYSPIYYKGGY